MPEERQSRLGATLREGERVTPLELFFDLVFVLAITQCTALMSHHPTWSGIAQGLLVLGMLWWAWTGYAWLTSVLDPTTATTSTRSPPSSCSAAWRSTCSATSSSATATSTRSAGDAC